jgi:hypothetical protein
LQIEDRKLKKENHRMSWKRWRGVLAREDDILSDHLAEHASEVARDEDLDMTVTERGRIKGKSIVFPKPLGFPDGTEVFVRVESVEEVERTQSEAAVAFAGLPFFGMWADRPDMQDSASWVNEERATWQTRSTPQD